MNNTIPSHTRDFINAVVNPFEADQPARVPDIENLQSVCFRDASETMAIPNPFTSNISGVVVFGSYGLTGMRNTFCDATAAQSMYHLGFAGIDAFGGPLLTPLDNYISLLTQNYSAIFGIGPGGIFITSQALVQALRIVSYGLRILPAIETVTDTSVPYISYYLSGQLTPTELQSWMSGNGYDIRTLTKSSPFAEVYGNNEGTCNRFDPVQKRDLFATKSIQLFAAESEAPDDVRIPTVCIMFSQALAPGDVLPFITHSQWWLECVLRQPTPIYASPSPVDPNFEVVLSILSQSSDIYPIVSKGHSLKSLSSQLPSFMRNAAKVLSIGASFTSGLSKTIGGRKARRGRPRKQRGKKQKRTKPRKGRGRIGNARPSAKAIHVRN